jgi:uncharacterized protein DUF2784
LVELLLANFSAKSIMLLADIVLVIHFFYVLFVVGSLPVIWIGAWLKFGFVRNFWFRFAHLAAILFVVAESLVGVTCPLTVWENALRQVESDSSFMQVWLHRIMFFSLPEWVFTVAYILFALLIAITFKLVPPNARKPSTSSILA